MEQAIENIPKKQKHKKKKTPSSNSRLVFVLVAAALAVYLGSQIFGAFSNTYETEPAVHVTVNDSFTDTGWFFRDETTVSGGSGDSVKHIVYRKMPRWRLYIRMKRRSPSAGKLSRSIIGLSCWILRCRLLRTARMRHSLTR